MVAEGQKDLVVEEQPQVHEYVAPILRRELSMRSSQAGLLASM